MTEMDKLFNHKPKTPTQSIIEALSNDKLIDITVWYDYDPGYNVRWRYIIALFAIVLIRVILKRRTS